MAFSQPTKVDRLSSHELILFKFVPGRTGKTFKVYNPVTEEPICDIHEALPEDVDLAVNAAQMHSPLGVRKMHLNVLYH
jgi:acyl-CoA reductase-like NAD-dependent aldehyde dehydrogenase